MMHSTPKIAAGDRIYAIGDIHGQLELFAELIALIRKDAAIRPARRTRILVIGDMIDRGPRSREIVDRLRTLGGRTDKLIVLRGNHEQVMLDALTGSLQALEAWLQFGGDTTLMSWGVPPDAIAGPLPELFHTARSIVGRETLAWLGQLPLSYQSGDYFFVHAGIRPGIELDRQAPADLLWIRDDFLDAEQEELPAVIVHGHSICEHGPELLRNRIGLDTGAYRTGRLSAVGFEGSRQWAITTARPKRARAKAAA